MLVLGALQVLCMPFAEPAACNRFVVRIATFALSR